jgi:ribonuclease-3
VTTHLFPSLEAGSFGAGRLTKIRAQAVSGRSCRRVAEDLGVPERMRAIAPPELGRNVEALLATERVLASVIEAVIGAIYLHCGYETTAAAVVEAFAGEVSQALEFSVDFKSELQEQLAQNGNEVVYEVEDESGPPHDRRFTVAAQVGGETIGRGAGRSKKDAEQNAAAEALEER